MKNAIIKEFLAHQETIAKVIETMQEPLLEASKLAVETLRAGNKILLCGNGGSAPCVGTSGACGDRSW